MQRRDSLPALEKAAEFLADDPEVHSNLGSGLLKVGRFVEAAACCHRALQRRPDFPQAHNNLGRALQGLGKPAEALASYRRALQLDPQFAQPHSNLAIALLQLGQLEEAAASCRRALQLQPSLAEAHKSLGDAFLRLGQSEEAVASYQRALQLNPDLAGAHNHLGNAWLNLGRLDEARASYHRAIALKPDFAEAHFNLSLLLLLQGDLENGWSEYEWRRRISASEAERGLTQPPWLGKESLAGKRIVLYGEQGLGDTLQFCRYVKSVASLGAEVILEVPSPLTSLLAGLAGLSQIFSRGDALPEVDYQCPLLSLPWAFGTRLQTIPCEAKYLNADAAKVAQWQARLGEKTRARIGLVWSGNTEHRKDRERSIPLKYLAEHLPLGPQYVSLQKDLREGDLRMLEAHPQILHWGEELRDFTDTAALCECLDVVISVDTSVAHLSAALGKATWILLSYVPDWRWLLERGDSPWYPSARLYRQPRPGCWQAALEQVRSELIDSIR